MKTNVIKISRPSLCTFMYFNCLIFKTTKVKKSFSFSKYDFSFPRLLCKLKIIM